MAARFLGQVLLVLLAAVVAAAISPSGAFDSNPLAAYVAAFIVGVAAAVLARVPNGLPLIWVGALIGVVTQLSWQSGAGVGQLEDSAGIYVVSLALASVTYLAGRYLFSRRVRALRALPERAGPPPS
jgi:hypothetical protein